MKSKHGFFSKGDTENSVFYLQKGRAKVTVVSKAGNETPSHFSILVTSSERMHLQRSLGCA
jgi:hypothetical protein